MMRKKTENKQKKIEGERKKKEWCSHKASLLAQYMGRQECGISSQSLYYHPQTRDESAFCGSRGSLLQAMSNGGRHGFDAAYASQGKLLSLSPSVDEKA